MGVALALMFYSLLWLFMWAPRANASVSYLECLPPDTELRACPLWDVANRECTDWGSLSDQLERIHLLLPGRPISDWEMLAIEIITADTDKGIANVVETDCGATGIFHLQPPDPLDAGLTTSDDCPIEDDGWRESLDGYLYSPYSVALQVRAWRRIVGPAVQFARNHGLEGEELAVVASIANSTGSSGAQALMSLVYRRDRQLKIPALLDAYIEDRDTPHRRARAQRLLELL